MVIVNGVIHPVSGPVIPNGFVAWEGNRITAVGPIKDLPKEDLGEVLDAQGGHVTPGYIDAHCHLGLFGDGLGYGAGDANGDQTIAPEYRALDALKSRDRAFAEALAAGVTTVVTGPGSASPMGGQMVCVKTLPGPVVVKAPAAMKLALGETPRKQCGGTRMAVAALLRETLERARRYEARKGRGEAPEFDAKLEALAPVVRGELAVHVHAHRADDIETALALGREFGLKLVLLHGTEGHFMAETIARSGCPVITGPALTDRSKAELKHLSLTTPAVLARAGAKVAICTDHPEVPAQYLPLCAALAVRGGMEVEEALRAITLAPAEILGLGDALGSLSVGKEADIVLTPGHPLDATKQAGVVILGGKQVAG